MTHTTGGCAMTNPAGAEHPPRTLADLRKQAGLTQGQVAASMGIGDSQVSRLEAQFPDVAFSRVQAYLKALGGHIIFTEWDLGDIWATSVIADPTRQESLERRRREPGRAPRSQRPPKN